MENIWLYALLSALAVSLLSFVGMLLLSMKADVLHRILRPLASFAAGALLGNAAFHLLPEAWAHLPHGSSVAALAAGGFGVFFLLGRVLHRHAPAGTTGAVKGYGYLSLWVDALHNLTDGVLIGVSWMASPETGAAVTAAVMLHELPQELGDFGVLVEAGFSRARALWYNFASACTALVGTALTLWVGASMGRLSLYILPFAAGGFVYLAAVALLPELLREAVGRQRVVCVLCMVLGAALMAVFATLDAHAH